MKRPVLTARTRIAGAFGGIFLMLGAGLLVTVNLMSRRSTRARAELIAETAAPARPLQGAHWQTLSASTLHRVSGDVSAAASQELIAWSAGALLAMALLAVGVGWWTAGRFLTPVQGAFDSQRRFIANASHELRTPLATQRAAIQVGLEGEPSAAELARTRTVLLETNRKSERIIEGLLVLAGSEHGIERPEPFDLDEVVAEEVAAVAARAEREGVTVVVRSGPAPLSGNRVLMAQLVGNLLRNAVGYNHRGGRVEVAVEPGRLVVANTGPVVRAAEVEGLFQPFRRGEGRERLGGGAGLGLSIVRSIARAHGGTAEAVPRRGGGLRVTVDLARSRVSGRSPRPGPG